MRNIYISILFTAFLFTGKQVSAQLPYIRPCYGIDAGADSAFCSTVCANISRTAVPQYNNRATNTYVVQQMTIPSPAYNVTGSNVIVDQDDIWSGVINIGFNFCFFGNTYNRLVIGANGLITFNLANAGAYCNWSYTGGIPDATKPTNSIMGAYMDIDPSIGFNANRINYYTEGTAPCRRFVINFYQVPLYSAACNSQRLTSQIVLHEAYNIIDIIITNKPVCSSWNGGRAIVGIQNNAGNLAFTATGANPSTAVMTNQCWRFLPNGPLAQTINWTQGGTVVSNTAVLTANLCPTSTTPFLANLVNTRCDGSVVTVSDAVNFTVNGAPIANAGANTSLSCIAPNIGIGAPPVGGYTYTWSPTSGLSNPNIANPTTTTPNTYIVTVTNTATGCVSRDTVIVSPLTNPTANAGPDRLISCAAPTVTIGTPAIAGHSYTWSPSAGLSNPNIAEPIVSAPNTYTLTITNTATGCTDTDDVTVTQNNTPPIADAGTNQTISCIIGSVTIGTPAVFGNTYSWSPAAGLSNAGIAQPTASAPNTYTLTVTNTSNGCTATDAVVISSSAFPPVANAGADQTLTCTNTSFVIGSSAVAGNTYSWSPATGLSDPNIAQPTASLPNTYTLTVTNTANGCSATDDVIISQDIALPVANAGANQTLTCATTSVAIGTTAVAGNTYAWSPAAGLSNSSIAQPSATLPNTYTLTVTNTANGCTATDAVSISQNITPPVASAGANQTLTCATTSVSIGTAAVAGNTYAWSPAAGLSNASIAQPNTSAPNTYTLTVTNTANGCTTTDAVIISQNTTPPVADAGADKTLTCAIPSVSIGTAAVVGNTYAWSPAAGLSNSSIAQPSATLPNTYTLTVTNTANGCTATDAVSISQNITPPVASAGANQTLTCATTLVSIGTAAVAGNTYAWSPAAGLSNSSIAQPSATLPNTYTLTVTNTANGCTATDAVTISQNTTPPVANAGANQTLTCATVLVSIGTTAVAGNTYTWSPAAGLSNASIAQPNASAPNTYTLTVTNTANGCSATDAVIITQNTTPPLADAGADKTLTCAVTSVSIGTTAVAGNTYAWSTSTGLSNTAIAQPIASAPNTYTLTVTNTANGCSASDAVTVSQDITPPVPNAGADKTLTCAIPSVSIGTAAVVGNTYAWSPVAGLSNAGIAQPNATLPNTYTLTVTNTANGCTATDDVTISQNITPPVASAGANQTLTCATVLVSIGTTAVAGNTYTWSPAAGLSNASIAQPNASAPNTYTLTVTNIANGCTATDAITISQNITPPVANAGADQTLTCATTSVSIGTAAIVGNTYAWSPATGLSSAAIAQPTTTLPNTYTLTVTNTANGCTATDVVTISKDITPPLADAGADKTLTCAIPSLSIGTSAIAGNTYAWSPAAGLSNASIAQPNASAPNTYTLTVTNTANGCTATDAVTISQNTTPPIANAGANQTLTCATVLVSIGTTAVAGNTYTWSPAAGLSNASIAQPNASAPNTYTLTVTNTANGCSATDAVIISQNTTPPLADAGADKTLTCAVTSVSIGTTAVAGNTYSWSTSTGLSNTAIAQPIASAPNTYTLTVTNTANGCTATDVVNVSKDITPPLADAGADKTLTCATTSVPIGTTSVVGNTYAWSSSAGLSNAGIAQPNATLPNTYTVTVTNTANGCSSTDAVTITIDTLPPVANAGLNKTLTCAIPSVSIGTAALVGNTYSWSPAADLSNAGIAQPTASAPNTYTLTVTKTSNGCKANSSVFVLQNIAVPAAFAGNNLTLTCSSTSFLIGAPAISGNTYSWSPSNGLSNTGIAQPTVNTPGNYTLTITNISNGCTSTDEVTVAENTTPPVANAGADKTLTCTNKTLPIGSPATANNRYSWTPADGLNNISIAQPIADTTGTFTLTVTNTINGCSAIDSVNVFIDTIIPIADAGPDQTFPCPYQPLTLGTSALANHSYNWISGIGLSENTLANPTTDTSGTFVLRVTNTINGCKSAPDTVVISPKNCDCEFYVPTAFSPNNDGVNDMLYFYKDCDNYKDLSFSVFNRWGELVFASSDINVGWDGFYKTESQQIDGYVWVLQYFDILHNQKRLEKGVVTLLK